MGEGSVCVWSVGEGTSVSVWSLGKGSVCVQSG